MPIPLDTAIQRFDIILNQSMEFSALADEEKTAIQISLLAMMFISNSGKFEPTASSYHLAQRAKQFRPPIPQDVSDLIRLIDSGSSSSLGLWIDLYRRLESAWKELEHPPAMKKPYRHPHNEGSHGPRDQQFPRKGKGFGPPKNDDEFGDNKDP